MRGIFRRVFKSQKIKNPSLPPNLSLSRILEKTVAGFLARDMALESQMDKKEADLRFYYSIFHSTGYERHQYLELTEKLMDWIREDEDIERKIDDLSLSMNTKNLMLAVLKKYRQELEELLNPAKKTSLNDRSSVDDQYLKWKVYRDVIYACTNKHFLLISRKEMEAYKTGEFICEGKIHDRFDIPKCRDMLQRSLETLDISKNSITNWLLAVSEAITNTIKHANKGEVEVYKNDNSICVIVEDNGPGFDLDDLPNTTLMAGYSTKQSLGQGFVLMMKMTERLLLYTSSKGSSIILIFKCN